MESKKMNVLNGAITTISLFVLCALWLLKISGLNLIYQKFDIVLGFTILFLLRSSIASFISWKDDPKGSPERSTGMVVIGVFILLFICIYYFLKPLFY